MISEFKILLPKIVMNNFNLLKIDTSSTIVLLLHCFKDDTNLYKLMVC